MDNTYFTRTTPELRENKYRIFVNQAGFFPEQAKKAVLTEKSDAFSVVSDDGKVCFSGKTRHFGYDECSGDDVYEADFSDFRKTGLFRIADEENNLSAQFRIGEDCCDKPLRDLMRAFYFLRCGCPLKEEHAGKFTHAACHTQSAQVWDSDETVPDVSGGWHDAGDYGRYVTAAAATLAHLFNAYRLFPSVLGGLSLNIPESGGVMPDFLAECKYELEWILKMQRADGAAYHKATTKNHAGFVMPEEDNDIMYVFTPSSMATADLCAIAAMASGIYRDYDSGFSERLFSAAEKAYKWLKGNPDFLGFRNPEGNNTGSYGEREDVDNRFWAECEMYAATGEGKYLSALKESLEKSFPLWQLGYAQTGGFGALSYIYCDRAEKPAELTELFLSEFLREAQRQKIIADNCGYGAAMRREDYCWGSNLNLLKRGMLFAIADRLCGRGEYRDYACAQFDYLFGRNATGYSYVSGNGEYSMNYPHLRPAYADGIDECMPGMVSGGANGYPNDADAKILIPEGTPPMKCYADDYGCYSLNEVAIYWNSPAVFLAAYLKDEFGKDNSEE